MAVNLGGSFTGFMLLQRLSLPVSPQILLFGFRKFRALLSAERNAIMAFIPSSERSGVHDDDGILDQRLRPNKLVVGGIVNYIDNAGLSRTVFAAPTEVAVVQTESTKLHISAHRPDCVDTLYPYLRVGCRSAQFILALLAGDGSLSTGLTPFMNMIS